MTNLASLYAEYKKNLKKNDLVMQDDILSVPLQIEAIVRWLVGPVKISDTTKGKYQNNWPLKDSLEYEASVIHELIGKDFTTYDLLEGIENRQKEVREILSEKSYKEICEELGITYRLHTDGKDRPFVPTKWKDKAPITGSGSGWEKEKKSPKLLELISLLGRIETPEWGRVDTRDILVDFQSETPDSMMRTLPYVVVRIPRLSRTILIDDRIGEATFVLEWLTDLSIITSNHKWELETHHGAKKVIYDAKWKDNLMRYLMTDWNETWKEEKNTPTPRVDVDMASLFMDAETIRVNLEKFAEVEWIEISELSTINPNRNTEVTLSNGVRMKWRIFLNNASKYLLWTRNRWDNPHRQAEALYKLSETSGQISMNEQYFRNITALDQKKY